MLLIVEQLAAHSVCAELVELAAKLAARLAASAFEVEEPRVTFTWRR
jgi:hypothetical protein